MDLQSMCSWCCAGEEGDAQNIWDTINHLKVRRIDHGVHCVDDPALIEHLEGTQLPLTVCPLSNQKVRPDPTRVTVRVSVRFSWQGRVTMQVKPSVSAFDLVAIEHTSHHVCGHCTALVLLSVSVVMQLCMLQPWLAASLCALKLQATDSDALQRAGIVGNSRCTVSLCASAAEGVRRQPARGEEAGRAAVAPLLRHLQQR